MVDLASDPTRNAERPVGVAPVGRDGRVGLEGAVGAAPQPEASSPPIGVLARHCPAVSVRDPLAVALSALRRSTCGAVPVLSEGRLVGLVREADLRPARADTSGAPMLVGDVMQAVVAGIPGHAPPQAALQIMDSCAADVLPVMDLSGTYRGLLTRSDVLEAVSGAVTPDRIGGMATPLGVYLTSGSARGGPGDLGLFLTGVALFACVAMATAVVFALTWFISPSRAVDLVYAVAGLPGAPVPWAWAAVAAALGLFFRASPLAAYHAAEHQVVNAMERGLALTPERVSQMPRVHPRCGTNLVVVGVAAATIVTVLGGDVQYVAMAVIIALFMRFTLGGLVQYLITTKPPGPAEIASGIRAAEQLIERHQATLGRPVGLFRRVWSMGMIQVALGLTAPAWILSKVLGYLNLPIPL